jgi:hypothetical protein
MATRDEPIDPQEVLAAAEAAHLAARRTVPITHGGTDERRRAPVAERETVALERETVRLERNADRKTVRLDRETVRLPRPRPGGGERARAPLPVAAGFAAGWAALVSFVPVAGFAILLQAAEAGPFAVLGSVRLAAAGWLLAHGVPLQTPSGPVGLAPLALSAFAAWRVARAGVHVTRTRGPRGRGSVGQALAAAGAVAIGYALIGTLAAAVARGPGWSAPVPRTLLTLAVFGFVAASYGSLRATGVLARWLELPPLLRQGARAGLVAATVVLAAGAAVAGMAIAAGGGPAAEILAAYRTGVAGQAGLTLLCLMYAPNLAGWAMAYLVGPGFAVGADTVVRSSEVAAGPLPALPVFAGLPDGPLPTAGAVLLVVPVVAGAIAGWLLARSAASWGPPLFGSLVSSVVAGGLLGLVAAGSAGSLGGGRLATFGPDPLPVAMFSALTVLAGAVLATATTVLFARRRATEPASGAAP